MLDVADLVPFGATWNGDGDRLAFCFARATVHVWALDLAAGRVVERFSTDLNDDQAFAFRPDEDLLAGVIDGLLTFWISETDDYIETDVRVPRRGHLSWSCLGRYLCVERGDGEVTILDVPSRAALLTGSFAVPIEQLTCELGGNAALFAWSRAKPTSFAIVVRNNLIVRQIGGGEQVVIPFPAPDYVGRGLPSLAWTGDGRYVVASAGVSTWVFDTAARRFATELGAVDLVLASAASADGSLLARCHWNSTVQVWSTGDWVELDIVYVGRELITTNWMGMAFHPKLPIFATVASSGNGISVYRVTTGAEGAPVRRSARYAVAKVVLVGESGVGKTHLGYRLATGSYKDHPSTHGQQFWLTEALTITRDDGTRCEVVLWDLAGQPDYRLIHVLFLGNADAAVVVFDAARRHESLDAVTFWAKALQSARPECRTVLVSARADRGNSSLTADELDEFTRRVGIDGGHLETSALNGAGVDDLAALLTRIIPWDELPVIVESPALAAIKEQVLRVKQRAGSEVAVPAEELAAGLRQQDGLSGATQQEIDAALRDLEVRGYVHVLTTGSGERIVLLRPEILNNLAASLILEARRNERGLGAVDEAAVTDGGYGLREMSEVTGRLGKVLAESVVALLLDHNICFRERLGERSLLIFPELINEKPPRLADSDAFVDDVTYVVSGSIENVYASLVVLLGYTNVLIRADQWQNQAQYVLDDHPLRFRQVRPKDDELEVVLSYPPEIPDSARRVFEGLIEQFLSRRAVEVRRYPRVDCTECGFTLDRSQVIRFIDDEAEATYCPRGGHRIVLPTRPPATRMSEEERRVLREESATARSRTAFAVAMTRLRAHVTENGRSPAPDCFVSYAWGRPAHETWVREKLVPDLEEAGIGVILDVAVNRSGDSLTRFVELADAAEYVLVVGTPDYLVKYANARVESGTVVAAEGDLVNRRLVGPEARKSTVVPVLREATIEESLPPLVRTRLPADLRDDERYFTALFDLIVDMYRIDSRLPVIRELRRALEDRRR